MLTFLRSSILAPALIVAFVPGSYAASCTDGPRDRSAATFVEVTSFRTAEKNASEVALDASEAFLCRQDGFLGRELLLDKDGYTDVVYWRDADAARAALAASETDQAIAPFMQAIDPTSVTMRGMSVERRLD